MLRIDCPHCGPRDETEFVNGGEAHVARPAPDAIDDAGWAEYLFFHRNPRGLLREQWLHAYGCRRWFHTARDTASHEIVATYGLNEMPELPE